MATEKKPSEKELGDDSVKGFLIAVILTVIELPFIIIGSIVEALENCRKQTK